jgi:4-hydroxybenzoate polyprenyltransferase
LVEVYFFTGISFVLLFWAASQLNALSMELLPLAVFFLVFYSYTKRFTWLCHAFLGLTIALAPLGGWVAVTGEISPVAIVFYITVACWTAGFDVIYACQDMEYDRSEGLYSIPGRFGIRLSLLIARGFHVLTVIGFTSLFVITELSWWYFAGLTIAYGILYYEHRLVKPHDLTRLNTAFFTMNGVLSIIMFSFTLIDLVVG